MTDFECCEPGGECRRDPLAEVLADALNVYGTPDSGLPVHLAAVLRRTHPVIELVPPPSHPVRVRLWSSTFEFLAGDDAQATTRLTEDGRIVTVPVSSPLHEAAEAVPPDADLNITIEAEHPGPPAYQQRWAGRVESVVVVDGGFVDIRAVGYQDELKFMAAVRNPNQVDRGWAAP